LAFSAYVFGSGYGSWPSQSTKTSRGTDGVWAGGRNVPSGCIPQLAGSGSAGSPGTRWKSFGSYFFAFGTYGEPAMVPPGWRRGCAQIVGVTTDGVNVLEIFVSKNIRVGCNRAVDTIVVKR
jgi:hypothetical protein